MASMGKEKVTWLRLKVDISTEKSYNRVKKALCSIPQVRDQTFDEKTNTVTCKVVCCSPEKVMQKLCEKGRGSIKTIESFEPPKPAAEKPKEAEKPKPAETPKPAPATKPPAPAPAGPSSQPMMMQMYPPEPVVYHNGSLYHQEQTYGYPVSSVYNSYNGHPPQSGHSYYGRSGFDHFNDENTNSCSIM